MTLRADLRGFQRLTNPGPAREIISALNRDDFALRNQTGSHQRYRHPNGGRVTVTFHSPGQTFRMDILQRMIRDQAQWTKEDLRRLGLL